MPTFILQREGFKNTGNSGRNRTSGSYQNGLIGKGRPGIPVQILHIGLHGERDDEVWLFGNFDQRIANRFSQVNIVYVHISFRPFHLETNFIWVVVNQVHGNRGLR